MVRERNLRGEKTEKGRCGAVLVEEREEEIWSVDLEREKWRAWIECCVTLKEPLWE